MLSKPGDAWRLMRSLRSVFEQPELCWRLRDAARSEAFSFFSRQRYSTDLGEVYDQILEGFPVRVPELAVSGGMRFAGRP